MPITIENDIKENQRLDVALLKLSLAGNLIDANLNQQIKLNRSQIKKMIDSGKILVNNSKDGKDKLRHFFEARDAAARAGRAMVDATIDRLKLK